MKKPNSTFFKSLFVSIAMCAASGVMGQGVLENVLVETYYVSDADDATTTVGGTLDEGSVTYRVFITLCDDCRLKAVYGNENHPFSITSTEVFFNNTDRGKTWGFDIQDNRLDENTVALDSWLSFGGATDEDWGIPKTEDSDGSFVGGVNHEDGLLVNEAAAAGIPLTQADGLLTATATAPSNFFQSGDNPSTILGIETVGTSFVSTTFRAQADGIAIAETGNTFLVAQLTTKGDLTFDFNFEILDANGQLVKVVSSNEVLEDGEVYSPFLSYPLECGCTDPYFLEYDASAACDDGSCITEIVFGCNDPEACNYDSSVNFNVPELCCILPDNCTGLDIDVVCPEYVGIENSEKAFSVLMYPNPASDAINLNLDGRLTSVELRIYNLQGEVVVQRNLQALNGVVVERVETENWANGLYLIEIRANDLRWNSKFVKSE